VTDAFLAALAAELGKKTGVCWLRDPGAGGDATRPRAAWHIWHDDALHLVAGGDEQPLDDLAGVDRVEVTMRSKEHGGRLLTWVGRVSAVSPEDDAWEPATTALMADRLNLPDLGTVKADWAARSVVLRIDPTGETLEEPGRLPTDPHLAPPPATPAGTRGPLPRVLHRRQLRRPGLS
jgi:hypothetical protein